MSQIEGYLCLQNQNEFTPSTETLSPTDARKNKKGNDLVKKKMEGMMFEDNTRILQSTSQDSISSLSTNTTVDYERIKPSKNIKLFNVSENDDTILKVKGKNMSIQIKNPPLDFKQFLDETQKEKLKREEERKEEIKEKERQRKTLLANFDQIKKKTFLSSSSISLISSILQKKDEESAKINKIDQISQRLLGSIAVQQEHESQEQHPHNSFKKVPQKQNVYSLEEESKEVLFEKNSKSLQGFNSEETTDDSLFENNSNQIQIHEIQDPLNQVSSQNKSIVESISPVKATLLQNNDLINKQMNEKVAAIMDRPSLKQRYEELISSEEIEFTLPYKYKLLLSSFEKFEECILFFRDRQKPTLFTELKSNMEQSMRSSIQLKQLQQIIHIFPQSYQLKWTKTELNMEKYELIVNYAQNENGQIDSKQERCSILKQLLIEKVKYYHNLYLKSINQLHLEKDLLSSKVWHTEFDLQSIPQLDEQQLPLKPFEIKVQSLGDALQKNSVKNELLAKLMQSKVQEQERKKEEKKQLIERSLFISTSTNKTGLSDRLYQLIKAKEQKLIEEKQKMSISSSSNNNNSSVINKIPEIKKVCEVILVYYIQRKVSNIFYTSLLDHIMQATNIILSRTDAIEILDYLIQMCPFWITSIPNKQGVILRLNKSVPLSKVLAAIEK